MVAAFARLSVSPAYRKIYDAVEGEIMAGRLHSGDLLPTEVALAAQFGVNRSTIREGIRLLEQGGLVQREGGKRLRVALPHYRDLATRASRALVMHQITFRELWEASMALETTVADLAAARIRPAGLKALAQNIKAMKSVTGDDREFIRLDIAFHDILAAAAGNRALLLAREPIGLLFFPAGQAILPRLKTHKRVVDAHQAIHDALKARSREAAHEWMKKHMADFRRAFERTGLDMDQPVDIAALAP